MLRAFGTLASAAACAHPHVVLSAKRAAVLYLLLCVAQCKIPDP